MMKRAIAAVLLVVAALGVTSLATLARRSKDRVAIASGRFWF